MDCPKCNYELQHAELSLRTKGHGVYEQCHQAFLELNGEAILHERKGGFFLDKKKAEAKMDALHCPKCGIVIIET